ncbi:hypothetical protein ACEWY4_006098 [Coilia grayii]|uniref:PiggyBac transposable element-derived protein domain-containing protein n=1 Tax=Coilia grayii TaxID=363190 RepID=A0ABD1KCU9_9TELE
MSNKWTAPLARGDHYEAHQPLKRARRATLSPVEWKTEKDVDTAPPALRFRPLKTPGVQVDTTVRHSPANLFRLFFSPAVVRELCNYTNTYAAVNAAGKSYAWVDVHVQEFYLFLGLQHTAIMKLPSVEDYWSRNPVLGVTFAASVMTRARFQSLLWNSHLSDLEGDQQNDLQKGQTPPQPPVPPTAPAGPHASGLQVILPSNEGAGSG